MQPVHRELKKQYESFSGISQATINLASEKLFVEYDSSTLELSAIKAAVAKIGYEVVEKSENANVTIPHRRHDLCGLCPACGKSRGKAGGRGKRIG